MSYHPCVFGCGRYLALQDSHDCCLTCLGIQNAEEAFVDGSCSSCGDMTILELRNRLCYVKHGGVALPLPWSGVCPGTLGGAASGGPRQTRRQVQVALRRGQPRDGGDCSSGDGDCTTPSPGGGPAGEYLFPFVFIPLLAQQPAVPKTSVKEWFPQSLGRLINGILMEDSVSKGGEWLAVHHGNTSLLLSRQQAAVGCPRALLLSIHGTKKGL